MHLVHNVRVCLRMCVCMCVRVCVRVRAHVRACVCASWCAPAHLYTLLVRGLRMRWRHQESARQRSKGQQDGGAKIRISRRPLQTRASFLGFWIVIHCVQITIFFGVELILTLFMASMLGNRVRLMIG